MNPNTNMTTATSKALDVLAVMAYTVGSHLPPQVAARRNAELAEARAAVAELVEAAKEHPSSEQLPAIAAVARKILNSEPLLGHEKEFAASMLQALHRATRVSRAALAKSGGAP